MRRAIITVGLGFGDEGKGATVDYLTREYEATWWCGTAAGARPGTTSSCRTAAATPSRSSGPARSPPLPRTYLGPNVIIDPPALAGRRSTSSNSVFRRPDAW